MSMCYMPDEAASAAVNNAGSSVITGTHDGGLNNNNNEQLQTSSTSNNDNDADASIKSIENGVEQGAMMDESGNIMIKTPNSYKYPLLKRYYEFGPWIGRNRKAICLGCRLQTSSSQPDRLLKHLNKCNALTDQDKIAVQELMNERTANKRKKPMHLRRGDHDNSSEYYGDDEPHTGDDLSFSGHHSIPIPSGGLKRSKRDHSDKNSQIDDALTRFIMMCRIPLKAVHSPEFVALARALNPDYHIPSRETITNVLIPGLLDII